MAEISARRGSGTVRTRTTAGAVIVVGLALVVASVLLLVLTRRSLERNVRIAAELRANDVAASLRDGAVPSALRLGVEEDVLVQVVDAAGVVLASSVFQTADRAMLPPPFTSPSRAEVVVDGEADPFIVVARTVATGGPVTVLVGRDLDIVNDSVAVVARNLLVGVPILLVVVGITTWWVAGRALAPVEAIRGEVAAISARELHRRVPEPAGRDEIGRLARTMNEMLDRLEASHARQLRLVSDASHELRSPIAAIRQHAEVALAHPGSTTVEALAADALAEDLRLQRVAEDLLLLARVDEHALRLSTAAVDLDDLVLAEATRVRDAASVRVETKDVGPGRVRGDRAQLERVVRNLVDNASTHARTTIRLALRAEADRVVLEVDDDGPGIPSEFRSAVFERFARLGEARDRRRGGVGLGLSIVAELVHAHDGTVEGAMPRSAGRGSRSPCLARGNEAHVQGGFRAACVPFGHREPRAPPKG